MALRLGKKNVKKMLRGMSSIQWLKWKTYMELEPSGQELENYRAAIVAHAAWNVHVAQAQGAWDAAHSKKKGIGARPEFRGLHEFILRFGDAPDPRPRKRKVSAQEQVENLALSLGGKPVKG